MASERKSKPAGYWKDWNNVERVLNNIIEESGDFPTYKELQKRGYAAVATAIVNNHGGFGSVRERKGYEPLQRSPGYWREWDNVERELKILIEKNGRFPTQSEFREKRISSVAAAINRHHGGFNAVRQRMGFDVVKRDNNYWENFENVERELRPIIKELGYFPSLNVLEKRGYSAIANAISRHHGGSHSARKRMGYEPAEKPKNYWKNWDNVERELKILIEKNGRFPNREELNEVGISSGVISQYHGGINAVRERVGCHDIVKRDNGYWEDFDNVRKELGPIIEQLGHFPSITELRNLDMNGLSIGITRKQGGMESVKERMGFGGSTIRTPEEFTEFLKQNPTARNLASVAVVLNGERYEVEKVIGELYRDRFQSDKDIHMFISEGKEGIEQLTREGLTNLGAYIGEYNLEDRAVIPLLMGEALLGIPQDKITVDLENRLTRVLRHQYGPAFNSDPEKTLKGIEQKLESSEGNIHSIYQKLYDHYQGVIQLKGELN